MPLIPPRESYFGAIYQLSASETSPTKLMVTACFFSSIWVSVSSRLLSLEKLVWFLARMIWISILIDNRTSEDKIKIVLLDFIRKIIP